MNGKKQILVGFKISEDERPLFESIASEYGLKPGALAGVLSRKFIEAYNIHGDSIQFPPRYDFNTTETPIQQKSK